MKDLDKLTLEELKALHDNINKERTMLLKKASALAQQLLELEQKINERK